MLEHILFRFAYHLIEVLQSGLQSVYQFMSLFKFQELKY